MKARFIDGPLKGQTLDVGIGRHFIMLEDGSALNGYTSPVAYRWHTFYRRAEVNFMCLDDPGAVLKRDVIISWAEPVSAYEGLLAQIKSSGYNITDVSKSGPMKPITIEDIRESLRLASVPHHRRPVVLHPSDPRLRDGAS